MFGSCQNTGKPVDSMKVNVGMYFIKMKDDELPTPAGFRDAPMYIDPYFWLICMAHGWQIYHIDMGPSGEIGVPHMAKRENTLILWHQR